MQRQQDCHHTLPWLISFSLDQEAISDVNRQRNRKRCRKELGLSRNVV
jgi:hypothetical protein